MAEPLQNQEIKLTISAPPSMVTAIAIEVVKILNIGDKNVLINPTEDNENFTVKEAAEYAKCTPQTIRKHIDLGILKANKPGKSWVITKQNLDKYVTGN